MCKKTIKVIAFVLIFVVLFVSIQCCLVGAEDRRTEYRIKGFYELEEDTLDVLFIGSSATYAFWIAPYVWQEFGITTYPYASQGQSIVAAKHIIEDARKTQPNAKFIVNLSTIDSDMPVERFHFLCDNMPSSTTKFKMIYDVAKKHDYTLSELMECYFPIIRYHDRWPEITYDDVAQQDVDYLEYMSGNTYNTFLKRKKKGVKPLDYTQFYEELPESTVNAINELVDYCKEEEIDITFVLVPQASKEETQLGQQNAALDLVEELGYEVLDMRACADEVGIDYTTDFYNNKHTNIHGAIKVSNYISKHLLDKYDDLQDKRDDEGYSKWNESWDNYYDYVSEYLSDADMKYFTSLDK